MYKLDISRQHQRRKVANFLNSQLNFCWAADRICFFRCESPH
uniref:Uncharacterized protein n=1 Tax=Tetranychus urticae TaxID=32264 RepID=T1JPT6_TETUR